jgi:hypothetical protein
MSLMPSKLGADPKKIAILAGLVAVAGYFFISSQFSSSGPSSSSNAGRGAISSTVGRPAARAQYRTVQQAPTTKEFRPSLKPKDIDPATIDPTLRLDLLAKLKNVEAEAGTRSLFEILAAPPPSAVSVKEPEPIAIARRFVGPVYQEPPKPPPDPKAPPIPLKFYGFVNRTKAGDKRAFFMEGEEIIIASEGDVVKKRYKIVRIGVNSAVVEDTEFKSNNQQTLPLEAELPG